MWMWEYVIGECDNMNAYLGVLDDVDINLARKGLCLDQILKKHDETIFVFSSSATNYFNQKTSQIIET